MFVFIGHNLTVQVPTSEPVDSKYVLFSDVESPQFNATGMDKFVRIAKIQRLKF